MIAYEFMKKTIIIFTSSGGNGHISATKALQSYLSDEYEIKPVFIFEEVFKNIDPISIISFGRSCGEDMYNFFLRRRWFKILNFIYDFGNWYFSTRIKSMIALTNNYLATHKPDLIISVIPVVNDVILEAAQRNNIPFLLIPTDFDVTSFVSGIKAPSYPKFIANLASDDPLVKATITSAHINPEQTTVMGLPMRKDFFEPKDKEILKKQFGVETGKPVIVLMMGGQGNNGILAFSEQIAKLPIPAHVIICIGRNSEIKETIKKINFAPHISITVLGFTERISDLLAMADLLITKSGSVSFAEGITMNIPMILDATATLLYWESLNHILLTAHEWGISLKHTRDLNAAILTILGNPAQYQKIKHNLETFGKHRLDLEIKPVIEKLLA